MKYLFYILSFLCACTNKTAKVSNELNIAITAPVSNMDPANCYNTVCASVLNQIYEPLYEYNYLVRPYQLQPLLAQDMPQIDQDGLRYTIKIKKNIFYHPNEISDKKYEVHAIDFINQFRRLAFQPTKSNGWWLFKNKIVGLDHFRKNAKNDFSDFFSFPIPGLKALDKYTLQIKLKEKYPQLLYALAMIFTTPLKKEFIEFFDNDLSQNAIGTGPYTLKKLNPNHLIKLSKFKKYHHMLYPASGDSISHDNGLLVDANKKLPFIDHVNFYIMKEAQSRWLNFLKNKIDIITLSKDHFPLALNKMGTVKKELVNKDIKLQIAPTLTYWWISFNMSDPVLGKNLNLRKALAHAINIEEYIKIFTNNIGLTANSIYPPGIPGYSPTTKLPYAYNIKLAKEYLKKAGFPNAKGLPVFTFDLRSTTTVSRQMGEFYKKEFAKIGVRINVVLNSFAGFLNKARAGNLQLWQDGWQMDYPSPENIIQLLTSTNHPPGPNATYYANPKLDNLYKRLSQSTDKFEIIKLTKTAQEIINNDLPWIMQYYSRNYILHYSKVKNLRQSDLISNNIKYLRLK